MKGMAWDKFYWSDYDGDQALRMCSLAAQGLWMRMLCIMARAAPKGELRIGGVPCDPADLAKTVGEPVELVETLLSELDRRAVFSRTKAGVIINRKMITRGELSEKRATSGAKGAAVTNARNQLNNSDNPDLPQQNHGKDAGKPFGKNPALETRDKILEEINDQHPSTTSHARASPPPDDRSIARLVDVEFIGEQARILAGMVHLDAGSQVQLRLWIGEGIAAETILDTIRAVMANTDDHTSSLRRFDKPIRKEHAKTLAGPAKANGGGARYVSESGHVYHGNPQAVMREAEKRADWTTYYQAKSDTEQRS